MCGITGIFDTLGFSDYTNSTTATYTARDYCVQYRETDLNFISRLMEEEGIFYFFKHTAEGHKMVVANTPQNLRRWVKEVQTMKPGVLMPNYPELSDDDVTALVAFLGALK